MADLGDDSPVVNVNLTQKLRREDQKDKKSRRRTEDDKENEPVPVVQTSPAETDAVTTPMDWMKAKLPGVEKVSNKERRRRQNKRMRKLVTPKNALMVLSEMLPEEQLANVNVNLTQKLRREDQKDKKSRRRTEDDKENEPVPVVQTSPAETDAVTTPMDWMKAKLPGVEKVSNKERRRRQNKRMRKLVTPKNALMVLSEMLPEEQLANQFKVELASQSTNNNNNKLYFCAELTINGNTYKGYGENKLTARSVAAEQAIRDLIIQKKMNKMFTTTEGAGEGADGEESEDEVVPMIQLASFALHKLFSEWEYEGHKVPQLKSASVSISESGSEVTAVPKPKPKEKELPANAAAMHPCMLLTYMRPHLEYRDLAVSCDNAQNFVFTLGVDVDGSTYIGKAFNKKEARQQAARAACAELFGVTYSDNPVANAPQPAV